MAANLPVLSLNFVLITADELWALRYPDTHELNLLAGRSTVVVASEVMDADPGSRAIRPAQLVHVMPSLETLTHTVIDTPPAHPLSLGDLAAQVRASQQS